jgi:hypothetical protein
LVRAQAGEIGSRSRGRIKCAVLGVSGYDAQSATLPEAETLLQTEQYDLVVVSALMSKSETARILAAAGSTPTLVLSGFTLATDLLTQVERLLPQAVYRSFAD